MRDESRAVNEGDMCQSVRGVGSKSGWPYFAAGLYVAKRTGRGSLSWRLTASGPWCRTERAARSRSPWPQVRYVDGVRQNTAVKETMPGVPVLAPTLADATDPAYVAGLTGTPQTAPDAHPETAPDTVTGYSGLE